MAKKKISPPLYNISTGEHLDPAKDLQAPIPTDSPLADQAFTVVAKEDLRAEQEKSNKLSLDEAMQRDYGDLMREPSLLGVLFAILKELVRMRVEK